MSITMQMLLEVDEIIAKNIDNSDTVKALIEVKRVIRSHEVHRQRRNVTATQTLKEKVLSYVNQLHENHRRATVLGLSKKFHILSDEAKQYLAMAK